MKIEKKYDFDGMLNEPAQDVPLMPTEELIEFSRMLVKLQGVIKIELDYRKSQDIL